MNDEFNTLTIRGRLALEQPQVHVHGHSKRANRVGRIVARGRSEKVGISIRKAVHAFIHNAVTGAGKAVRGIGSRKRKLLRVGEISKAGLCRPNCII